MSKRDPKASPLRTNKSGRFASVRSAESDAYSVEQVRSGLPMSALDKLARELGVAPAALAEILGMSIRTLQRKTESNDRLGPVASDRLARVRRIQALANHVFGESEKATLWLTSPSRALSREIPLYLLDTDIGAQRVQQELRQIEFGIPV